MNTVFKHTSEDKALFSLHDSRSNHIVYENGRLVFFFPDGIYCDDYGENRPNTGMAAVEYRIESAFIYVFKEESGQTVRDAYTIEQLVQKVNATEWELEFAYRYDGYQEVLHTCWIWQNHEPWSLECQMFLYIGKHDAVFRWNPSVQQISE